MTIRPNILRRVTRALMVVAAIYAMLCVVGRFSYPRMLFPAPRLDAPPPIDPRATLLELPQPDGSHTVALHYPAGADARTVVMFHGNGETMFGDVGQAVELGRRGFGVLLVEYRGYGLTYGPSPDESMLYEDGEAALAYLAKKSIANERIVLWGWSLGTGVAAEMARRGHGARLVLLAPFTSVTDIGREIAPLLPVSLLMAHRFDTLAKAGAIHQPTLVIHGDADEVIPFAMGARVAGAIADAKLVRVDGGHHADLLVTGGGGQPPASALMDTLTKHMNER